MMKVYMFKPRFAPLVASGQKRTTIRPKRKNPTKPGDKLSLRCWEGKPYRSKQIILKDGEICKEVHDFKISRNPNPEGGVRFAFILDHMRVHNPWLKELAKADGFDSDIDMLWWFLREHDVEHKDFHGDLIKW